MSFAGARRGAALLLALSVGVVLADSSVVTLALPAILREFDAGVGAVAWVLIAFNLALAPAAMLTALSAVRRGVLAGERARATFAIAIVAFAAASLACAAAPSLNALIAARAAQGVVGAVVVAAALELLLRGAESPSMRTPRRAIGLWAAAGVLGGALGPALGGVLTEVFSWEAMFALQAPVVLVALAGARQPVAVLPRGGAATSGQDTGTIAGVDAAQQPATVLPRGGAATSGQDTGAIAAGAALVALALVSAALAAALFLLVVMLIEGWRLSPGGAAVVVTAMPLAALVATRWAQRRHRLVPAVAGSVLLAGGLAALGLLPQAGAGWTIAPQLAIGAGLGLALGSLIGAMVDPDRGAVQRPAAWTIAARHAGIVAGLLVLTPIFTADLDAAVDPAQRAGLARVLDASVGLQAKIALARALDAEVRDAADQELPDIDAVFARLGKDAELSVSDRAGLAALRADLGDELDRAATSAFSRSFLAAALLALLAAGAAAVALASSRRTSRGTDLEAHNGSRLEPPPSLNVALPAAFGVATLLVAAYVALGGADYGPRPVADPCAPRTRPAGIDRTQRTLLAALDGAACDLRSDREDLLLLLLNRRRPPGVSDAAFSEALNAGVDRAQLEGALSGLAAGALRLALKTGGPQALIGLLLGPA